MCLCVVGTKERLLVVGVFLVELYFVAVVRVVVVVGCSSRSKFAESDDVCGWLVGWLVVKY